MGSNPRTDLDARLAQMWQVYLFENGLVMTFDGHGEQMGIYQGPYDEVREQIEADCEPHTTFYLSIYQGVNWKVGKRFWFSIDSQRLVEWVNPEAEEEGTTGTN